MIIPILQKKKVEMSSKEKDVKTFDKLKLFFKTQKGAPGSVKCKDEYSLSPETESQLIQSVPTALRIKTIRDLIESGVVTKLDDNAPLTLWTLLHDLFNDESTENRHLVFQFFSILVQGRLNRLDLVKDKFFSFIKNHNIPEDTISRLEFFQCLTDKGKEITYLEDSAPVFILSWMPDILAIKKEMELLNILLNCMKYNSSYFSRDTMSGIIEKVCLLCCEAEDEMVVLKCLEVLETVLCYCKFPSNSLLPFITTMCRIVNIEVYCPLGWKIMRNLLGTNLGQSTLKIMCDILNYKTPYPDPGLLRGTIFVLCTSLWSEKRYNSSISSCTPEKVLSALDNVLSICQESLLIYEIVAGIQKLVNNLGHSLPNDTWKQVLELLWKVVVYSESHATDEFWIDQITTCLNETLDKIEHYMDDKIFPGRREDFFNIIQRFSALRPVASVKKLLMFLTEGINTKDEQSLDKLNNLFKTFSKDKRVEIRKKVIEIALNFTEIYRPFDEEYIVKIIMEHFGNSLCDEPNLSIRVATIPIVIHLVLNCELSRSVRLIDTIGNVLYIPHMNLVRVTTEDKAEDLFLAAGGLIDAFNKSMSQHHPALAVKAYEHIHQYLEMFYAGPIFVMVTKIRYILIEFLLKLRADSEFRVGRTDHERFSRFLKMSCNALERRYSNEGLPLSNFINYSKAISIFVIVIKKEKDWPLLKMVLEKLQIVFKSPGLFLEERYSADIDSIAKALCCMLKNVNYPECLINAPSKFSTSDFHSEVYPVVMSIIPYYIKLEPSTQQKMISVLETGMAMRSSKCINALTLCVLEMQDAMVKLLPEVLLNLSKISATINIANPVLEFLSTLTQLPKIYASFVGDQYMSVFAICLPYTNPFKFNHYVVSLAHHVIASWFLKCRLPFRRDFVKFIITGLRTNLFMCVDEFNLDKNKSNILNEDSSNRKRSSSLTEQSSRKRSEIRPSVIPRFELKMPISETLLSFHKELNETCLDLMAVYTYSSSSPIPRRNSCKDKILKNGQSLTWLVGTKLITVTTSGCTLKALKHGYCGHCYQTCKVQPSTACLEEGERLYPSNPNTPTTPDNDVPGFNRDPIIKAAYVSNGPVQPICQCWCKSWTEIVIKRPTGTISFTMRISNELFPLMLHEYTDPELLSYALIPSKSEPNSEEQGSRSDRVVSEPVSIPCSPIRKNVDFDDFDDSTAAGRSRNPVRRSNSSPEMSSNWKNPISGQDQDFELPELKKKTTYSKENRVNYDVIPEEMGTTPPASEATGFSSNAIVKEPIISENKKPIEGDPSGLPPLGYKRDRGHTISVMSPARKPIIGWGDSRLKAKEQSTTTSRSGINPAFVFLQLYHMPNFVSSEEKPILLTEVDSAKSTLKHLDWIPPFEVYKIGVLYIGPGQQHTEANILKNECGSVRYQKFLEGLGTLIHLPEIDGKSVFLGGLVKDGEDGKFSYVWQDNAMQVIFHVGTLMPSIPSDKLGTRKKVHIGNDHVTIVYNESGKEYNHLTIKAQFNSAVIVIEPLDLGLCSIIVQRKEELVNIISPPEYKLVTDRSVAIIARQLAVHASVASMVQCKMKSIEPYASNWLERLRIIKRLRTKLKLEPSLANSFDERQFKMQAWQRSLYVDDFTDYTFA